MASVSSRSVASAVGYLERQGYSSVTLMDRNGNVVLATKDGKSYAVIVDSYLECDEKWGDDAYADNFRDLAEDTGFDIGEVITVTYMDGRGDGSACLEHRTEVFVRSRDNW